MLFRSDLKVPNKVYALVRAFAANHARFHAADGAGYAFLAERVLELDRLNPQIAARMARGFDRWRKFDAHRQSRARAQLERIRDAEGLSRDVAEIVDDSPYSIDTTEAPHVVGLEDVRIIAHDERLRASCVVVDRDGGWRRRIAVLEKAFADIVERHENSLRDRGSAFAAVDESVVGMRRRLEASEQRYVQTIDDLKKALMDMHVRLNGLHSASPAQAAALEAAPPGTRAYWRPREDSNLRPTV